ncbi:GGDEF domain-containing protein [Haliea sp.]
MQTETIPTQHRPSTGGSVLENIVKLSSTGDIKLLDRIFLESICELLAPDYAVLCVFTARGNLTRVKRYRNPVTRGYETCHQQEALTPAQAALIKQARTAADGARALAEDGRQLAAYNLQNASGRTVSLLLQCGPRTSDEQMLAFRAIKRIYFNFRDFMDASQRDPLTGLLNRRYFDDCIHRALETIEDEKTRAETEAQRRATDTRPPRHWLAILDIDHFKKFNDSYGHLYGDEILLLFSRIMEQTFRESDLLFRFGGEEFVVITENANPEEAMAALERFRRAVQDYPFPQGEQVTVSCGAIEAVGNLSATSLLGKADEALYYAKNHGRNRTVMYEQLLASGETTAATATAGDIELF